MNSSILLKLAHQSIEEVIQAQNSIDKIKLLKKHSFLNEKIQIKINLYVKQELKGSYLTKNKDNSLLNNIILCAKKAAFEDIDTETLNTLDYPYYEIEIILYTSNGEVHKRDASILI